jgi:hypothetical protein
LDYERFLPTGRALITLTGPAFLRDNLRLLDRFTIAGGPVYARPKVFEDTRLRKRGMKGRTDAGYRGLVTGNGPNADHLQNTGKMVVITGFPGMVAPDMVASYFSDFKVWRSKKDIPKIEQVPLYVLPSDDSKNRYSRFTRSNGEFSRYARFAVTLESVSEAHRFVRHFHLTYFNRGAFGTRYCLYARVVC